VVVSGGISNIKDVKQLKKINYLQGVIIGKAIYDGTINLNKLKKLSY
jgi:phosphoribosylformimino-5-aminoimidazole carboxamide ribotide isomerase